MQQALQQDNRGTATFSGTDFKELDQNASNEESSLWIPYRHLLKAQESRADEREEDFIDDPFNDDTYWDVYAKEREARGLGFEYPKSPSRAGIILLATFSLALLTWVVTSIATVS